MKNIEVCLSPDLLDLYDPKGKMVVVADILRATSCIVTGIACGIESIRPVATLAECQDMQNQGYIGAAERSGKKVDGFHIGNSPFQFMNPEFEGRRLAITTTNGTFAITQSRKAKQLLIGAFLNFSALVSYLKNVHLDILIVCAGWKGKENVEDSLFAGALINALANVAEYEDDNSKICHTLYQAAQDNLGAFMTDSSHAKRLQKLGQKEDIDFCFQLDRYNVIPVLRGDELYKLGLNDMLA